ncbi:MAG: hypothetical protein V1857_05210 [archaeon]
MNNAGFWAALVIFLLTFCFSVAVFLRWIQLGVPAGQLFLHHWFSWAGAVFIAVFTPAYRVLKRRYPRRTKTLVRIHVFGGLFSFMLISNHIAYQLGRPVQAYPELGTGISLFMIALILTVTGFIHRFGLATGKSQVAHVNRYVHVALTLSFYIVVIVHAMRNSRIL